MYHPLLLAKIFDFVEYHGFLNMEDLSQLSIEAEQDTLSLHLEEKPVYLMERECEA